MVIDVDYIVLVDENNKVQGTAPKLSSHHKNTPLHRAFSLFIFNRKKELLLQQRADHKITWPGVWSNSVCGHQLLDEQVEKTVVDRALYELGVHIVDVKNALPDYRYRFEKDGIVENEICPVFTAFTQEEPKINSHEVKFVKWILLKKWVEEVYNNPEKYSPWCVEETRLLEKSDELKIILSK